MKRERCGTNPVGEGVAVAAATGSPHPACFGSHRTAPPTIRPLRWPSSREPPSPDSGVLPAHFFAVPGPPLGARPLTLPGRSLGRVVLQPTVSGKSPQFLTRWASGLTGVQRSGGMGAGVALWLKAGAPVTGASRKAQNPVRQGQGTGSAKQTGFPSHPLQPAMPQPSCPEWEA